MRKKAFLLIIQAYCFLYCLAQSTPDFRIPDYLPPSPDAAGLIKTGLVGSNLSTGAVNLKVPLYTFSGSKFSLPLSLSYSTTGVKVNDLSSTVGMGWTLDFGGVVTRTVLGMPDEMRVDVALNNFTSPPLNNVTQDLLDYLASTQADRESDIFSFNVLGLSGSFYLDSLFNPVSLGKNDLRISRWGGGEYFLSGFEITDDKGIRYRLTAMETTMKRGLPGQKCRSVFGYDDLQPQPTAWYLTCIKLNSIDSIVFNYNSGSSQYDGEVTQTLSKCIATTVAGCPPTQVYTVHLEDLSTCFSQMTNGVQCVNEIKFYDGSRAVFAYDDQRLEVLNGQRLKSLKIYSPDNKLIKYHRLVSTLYTASNAIGTPPSLALSSTNLYRTFLDRVEDVNTTDTSQVLSYKFLYNAPENLPRRYSYAQDHWGYYNGAGNSYFLPHLPDHPYASYLDGHDGNPVRNGNRKPSAQHMYYGTLQKITYPTGGYDTLLYESPGVIKYDTVRHYTPTYISVQNGEEWNELVQDTIYIPFDQQVQIDCGCSRNVDPPDNHGSCTFTITPHNPATTTNFYNNITVTVGNSSHLVFLKAGYYTMSASGTWDNTLSTFQVQHQYTQPTLAPYTDLVGGVIIGRIQSYTDQGQLATDKIYKYSSWPDSTVYDMKSITSEISYINLTEERKSMTCYGGPGEPDILDCTGEGVGTFITVNSSVVNPLSISGASPYYFKNVIEYSIDRLNNKNGYTLHNFSFADELGFIYDPPAPVYGWRQLGTPFNYVTSFVVGEERTRNYENYSGGYRLLSDKKNYYSLQSSKQVFNHRVKKKFDLPCGGVNPDYMNAYDVSGYKLWHTFVKMDSTEEITYSSLGDSLRTLTCLFYDNPSYTYATRTVTKNSLGQTIENIQQFPHDLTGSAYNTGGVITKMIQINLVSPPIIHTRKVGAAIADKLITTYREYPVNANNFLVDSVQQYSEDTLKNYMFNSSYDSRLNVTGMSSLQKPASAFIWDYQGIYLVASANNADPDNIASTSFETSCAGNWVINGGSINTTVSITGAKSYSLAVGNSIIKNGLSTGDYYVTYWSRNGSLLVNAGTGNPVLSKNGWTLYEHNLSNVNAVTIMGIAVIDELRLCPSLAQMTTFTYDPLVGLTSQCDATNRITYYEYDGFGRLKTIRDDDKNVLKTYDYQYTNNQ